MKIRSKFQKY